MTEKDVDPDDPRPERHYNVDCDAEWYYVDDDLAETFILGPATDAEPGDDWILTFTSAPGEDDTDRVAIRRVCHRIHLIP